MNIINYIIIYVIVMFLIGVIINLVGGHNYMKDILKNAEEIDNANHKNNYIKEHRSILINPLLTAWRLMWWPILIFITIIHFMICIIIFKERII